MTEREKRNEEWKAKIRRDAEEVCEYIDLMEQELKIRERMNRELAEYSDRSQSAQFA